MLDEPTNDLDLETLDLLQEVLADYDGTLILVSHDRDFLDRLATATVLLRGDGSASVYAGGWTDAVAQGASLAAPPKGRRGPPAGRAVAPGAADRDSAASPAASALPSGTGSPRCRPRSPGSRPRSRGSPTSSPTPALFTDAPDRRAGLPRPWPSARPPSPPPRRSGLPSRSVPAVDRRVVADGTTLPKVKLPPRVRTEKRAYEPVRNECALQKGAQPQCQDLNGVTLMFRRIVATAGAGVIAAAAAPAFAAGPVPVYEDRVIIAPETVIVPSADWTGPYVGAQLGWGWASGETISTSPISTSMTSMTRTSTATAWWAASPAVIAMTSASGSSAARSSTTGPASSSTSSTSTPTTSRSTSISTRRQGRWTRSGALKGLAGYDIGRTLVYGSAGWAHATGEVSGDDPSGDGWVIGAGADYALTEKSAVGGEYPYHQFSDFGGEGQRSQLLGASGEGGLPLLTQGARTVSEKPRSRPGLFFRMRLIAWV